MCDARALLDCTLTIIEPTVDYGKPVLWVVSHVRKTSLVVKETPAPARQRTRRKPAEVSRLFSRPERPLLAGKPYLFAYTCLSRDPKLRRHNHGLKLLKKK